MRLKSFIAMTGAVGRCGGVSGTPVHAQRAAKQQVAPVCANCHESQWNAIDLSAHGAKNDANGSMCQACHGDASEHLKDPMKAKPANPFGKGGTADERTAVCHDLPLGQPQPRVLDVGQAPAERSDVQQLPQHPRQSSPELRRADPDKSPRSTSS